jgi:hypothetical protein
MNLVEDFSRYATIIPEEHLPALARSLKRSPNFDWLLDRPHGDIDCLQGDLLRDFPTVFLDETTTARSRTFTVMILNNTCDLPEGRLDFVTAAPVVDFDDYLQFERRRRFRGSGEFSDAERLRAEETLQELARALRNNDKTEILYLHPLVSLMVHSCYFIWFAPCRQNSIAPP